MSNELKSLSARIQELTDELIRIKNSTECVQTQCEIEEFLSEPFIPILDDEDLEDWLETVRQDNINPLAP